MSAAAVQIHDFIAQQPELFLPLNSIQQEFLFWLIGVGLNLRTLQRFIFMLNQKTAQNIEPVYKLPDLYPTFPTALDIRSQIGELIETIRVWRMEKLFLLIDIRELELAHFPNEVQTLLNWSDLLEQPDFIVRVALPLSAITKHRVIERDNGRLNLVDCQYTPDEIETITNRVLQAVTNDQNTTLDQWMPSELKEQIAQEVSQLYGTSAIAGWLHWAETVLFESGKPLLIETNSRIELLRYLYYHNHVRLALDPYQQGVWRGPQFLSLEKQPYELVKKLFELRGQPSPDELFDTAGGQASLNTLTSRIRKLIEPLHIYLHNRRDLGYWLENFAGED